MELRIDRRTAILAAAFPTIALGLVNGYYKELLYTISPLAFWTSDFLNHVLIPIASLYFLARLGGIYPREYGFRNPSRNTSWLKFVGITVFICCAFWLFYIPPTWIAGRILDSTLPDFTYYSIMPKSGVSRFAVAVYFAITAGFVEETMFRALPWLYFCQVFPQSQRIFLYAITTAIVFGFIHWENNVHEVIGTAILGFFIAIFYAKFQNIWPFVIGHSLNGLVIFT